LTIQSFQIDPAAGGVSQATFDAHTHAYQKVTHIGGDDDDKFLSPEWMPTVDDGDGIASQSVDLEAVGIRLAATQTNTPS